MLCRFAVFVLIALMLGACGNKGPLVKHTLAVTVDTSGH
jgi:predicted small lipoprotein YifL